MTEEPLIYTSKGNVPIASLKFEHKWEDTPDSMVYIEEYRDETGEVVKRSAAVYLKRGMFAGGLAGSFS